MRLSRDTRELTDAQTIEFPVKVAPGATQTVRYVVEYNW